MSFPFDFAMPGSYPSTPLNEQNPTNATGKSSSVFSDPEIRQAGARQQSPQSSLLDEPRCTARLPSPHVHTPIPVRQTTHEVTAAVLDVRSSPSSDRPPQSAFDDGEVCAHPRLVPRKPTPFPMKAPKFADVVLQSEEFPGRVDSGVKNQSNFQASGEHDGTKYHTSPARMQRPSIGFDIDYETTKLRFRSLGRGTGKEIAIQDSLKVEPNKQQASSGATVSRSSPIAGVGAKRHDSLSDKTSGLHPGFRIDLYAACEHLPYSGIRDSPLYQGPPELRHLTGIRHRLRPDKQMPHAINATTELSPRPYHGHPGSVAMFPERPTVRSPLHQETVLSSPASSFAKLPEYTGDTPSPFPWQRRQVMNRTGEHAAVGTVPEVNVEVYEVKSEEEDEDGDGVVEGSQVYDHVAHEEVGGIQTEGGLQHGPSPGLWHVVKRFGKDIKGVFSGKLAEDGTGRSSKLTRTGHKAKSKMGRMLRKAVRGFRG